MRTWLCGTIAGLLLLAGCSGVSGGPEQAIPKPGQTSVATSDNPADPTAAAGEPTGKLAIWSYYDLGAWTRGQILDLVPNVEVSFHIVPTLQAIDLYKKALTGDEVPDLFLLEASMLGSFNDTRAFEDLAAPPYEAESLLAPYPEAVVRPYRHFDGTGLTALPIDTNPSVTYYRQDVMQEAGLPAEPEELAEYMEDPDNWLHMAQTLKKRGQWMISWGNDPLLLYQSSQPFFDSHMNYVRNTGQAVKAIELGRAIERQQLASMSNVFDMANNPVQSGELVMFQTGYWFRYTLEELAPDQFGKWRMTRLPFDTYGWSGSSAVAIAAKSANKTAAWQVAKWLAENHSRYIHELLHPASGETAGTPNAYFGEQKLEPLISELIRRMPTFTLTPLDEKANVLWWQAWGDEKDDSSLTAEEVANEMERRVTDEFAEEIEVLRGRLHGSRAAPSSES